MLYETQLDDLLSLYPVLLDLPATLRKQLATEAGRAHLEAGRQLFDVGSPCAQFLFVLRGSLRVVKTGASGREVLLYRVQPGDLCLLTIGCLLDSTSYAATATAETDVEAVGISKALFLALIDQSPSFRIFLLRFLASRTLGLIGLMEGIVFGRLAHRLAALLLSKGTDIRITHQKLADELGTTREVISRTLESMEEEGLVGLERGHIRVLDRGGLDRVASGR